MLILKTYLPFFLQEKKRGLKPVVNNSKHHKLWQDLFCKLTEKKVFMTKEKHGKTNTVQMWFPHLFIES